MHKEGAHDNPKKNTDAKKKKMKELGDAKQGNMHFIKRTKIETTYYLYKEPNVSIIGKTQPSWTQNKMSCQVTYASCTKLMYSYAELAQNS